LEQCRRHLYGIKEAVDKDAGTEDLLCEGIPSLKAGGQRTAVFVAVSGGGARATVFSSYVLALLEKRYDQLRVASPQGVDQGSFLSQITAFSTVSGGSILAHHVAVAGLRTKRKNEDSSYIQTSAMLFQDLAFNPKSVGMMPLHSIGWITLWQQGVKLPFGLFEQFTDMGYADDLAEGLEVSSQGSYRPFAYFHRVLTPSLETLPIRPRFFFNATILETGQPIVLTQRPDNLCPPPRSWAPVGLGIGDEVQCKDRCRPICNALTLEDIGVSSQRFPLAYAAAASAAYPVGVEPLRVAAKRCLKKGLKEQPDCDWQEGMVSLADGGIYDNSGLSTIADLVEYFTTQDLADRFVVIAINADNTYVAPIERILPPAPLSYFGFERTSPLPGLWTAIPGADAIHYVNKRRAEVLARQRIERAQKLRQKPVYYFGVSLLEVGRGDYNESDMGSIKSQSSTELRMKIAGIPTTLGLTDEHQKTLLKAAEQLVNERPHRQAISVSDAVARVILGLNDK
jgi:hypothetical protein